MVFNTTVDAQNLIENGDFESRREKFADGWEVSAGTPDFIDLSDDSSRHKYMLKDFVDGSIENNGYMGISISNSASEVFYQKLNSELEQHQMYEVSCKVLACHHCRVGFEVVTVAFTKSPFEYSDYSINYNTPCLKLTSSEGVVTHGVWTELKTIFKAKGNEKFITIGNFNYANTGYTKSVKEKMNLGSGSSCDYIIFDNIEMRRIDTLLANKAEQQLVLGDVFFESGESELKLDNVAILDAICKSLLAYGGGIKIIGYTDSIGTIESNKKLSLDRAENVKKYLVSKGYEENKILTLAMHEKKPVMSNATELGRSKNRRVEIIKIDEE